MSEFIANVDINNNDNNNDNNNENNIIENNTIENNTIEVVNIENNVEYESDYSSSDESDCTDDESVGYTSDEDTDLSDSEDDSADEDEDEIQELTPSVVVDICKILDTDEYQEELDPERVEMILNLVENGAVVFDNTDPRYIEEVEMIQNFRNQRKLTTDEIAAIIDLQEGREPCCAPEVLEVALEKISSGQFISFDYEHNEEQIEQVEEIIQPIEQAQEIEQLTWWEWTFGTNQQPIQDEQINIQEVNQTEQPKQEGTGCVMM